ncbi:E3 ubiquitin-protein ligase At1g63170 [Beta vulgaris subsp. vulgaris]|uniref:E3 ubiquitin-protein ligase At1g63170 n=1 Tax=Beta vulgaris subsp. vulgaris TaxID=3555 RepID=UPI00203690D1|nr:E3 ubiquitin-protein ligase At1g63170 [Beta vulgaris subsp. vulgaris]XP_010691253.2 E3 ubiquitin-protein ligase At1g63170 [Beta vulgaris subsp. vulgaris]XP_010691255.2 E3 ubiquitin-protein ligase At1g63170 [Beta vulgaris subsp. vulgaris]
MGIPLLVSHSETSRDQFPLLMDRLGDCEDRQHVIDIAVANDAPSSSSNQAESHHTVDRPSSSTQQINSPQSSSSGRVNSRSSSYVGRGDSYGYTSPLNSGLWISVELIVTLAQIVASVVILSLSRYNSSEAPLFAWVVGYACGCLATLPILYWRLRNCIRGPQRFSVESHQSSAGDFTGEASASTSSLNQEVDSHDDSRIVGRSSQMRRRISVRLNGIVDHFKMALDCFFAVWFVVGNVWIFGAHSSPSVAPKLYRLCIVFLTFSCIGYALPFLLCATIFCCLPCIISVMGIREDLSKPRGASMEAIDALPIYKFKLRKSGSIHDEQICLKASKDGILADGTQDERVISGEDALCCICLATYVDNDELRELPCSHLFHAECVDKWLKINASCPLCKLEVGEDKTTPLSCDRNNSRRQHVNDEGDLSLTPTNAS